MGGLTVKDVDFNGAVLKAAQDMNNIIWVGIRWVCDGIGLSDGQRNRQLNNIKTDLVISKGISNLVFPTNGGNQEVLCLMLDFLPLWLAKIHITPKMQNENPEVVEKLIEYQLKAKDVLANAFLWKEKDEVTVPGIQTVQLQMPTYDAQFAEINRKIDNLYSDMGRFSQMMMSWMQNNNKVETEQQAVKCLEVNNNNESLDSDYKNWKRKVNMKIDRVICLDCRFTDQADVMKYIYDYMRKNYGIVWEQETKEYMERNNCVRVPATIAVVYGNETLKSIFDAVLADLYEKNQKKSETECNISKTDIIIRPLIDKYNDSSNAGMHTYRLVYKYMDRNNKISWERREARYINKYGAKRLSKKNIINSSASLMKMFKGAVKALLEEEIDE